MEAGLSWVRLVANLVGRFFAWINRNRRLAKDVEATLKSAAIFPRAAAVMLTIRRSAPSTGLSKPTLKS